MHHDRIPSYYCGEMFQVVSFVSLVQFASWNVDLQVPKLVIGIYGGIILLGIPAI